MQRRVAPAGTGRPERRLGAAFRRRFLLRHHMAVLMAMVIGFGMFANYLLRKLGLVSMPVRYGVGVCCAYAAFFPLVSCWLGYIRRELELDLTWHQEVAAADGEPDALTTDATGALVATGAPAREKSAGWEIISHGAVELLGCFGEFAIIAVVPIVVVALMATVVGGGAWLFVEAPAILSEAAFETLLALSLIKPVKRMERPGWPVSIWRSTRVVFAGVLALAVVTGGLLQWYYPGATTLGEALRLRLGQS